MEIRVVAEGQSKSPTQMEVQTGKFKLVIDEPASMGGTDAGPSPMQALLMALAGCLNMTGHFVAQQQGITIKNMKVKLEGVMNPGRFMGMPTNERSGFQEITVQINADFADADQKTIQRWLEETESRCPITDNIRQKTKIIVNAENQPEMAH